MSDAMRDPRLPPLQWQIKVTDGDHSFGWMELQVVLFSFLVVFGGGLGYLAFKALGILIGI